MPVANGAKLGPYEILSPLGAGGRGEVYRARDTSLGRELALKILPVEVANDPSRRQRFDQEARAVAAVEEELRKNPLSCCLVLAACGTNATGICYGRQQP
jgi:serine/threonine protein kinase